jgi:hypothetical protein
VRADGQQYLRNRVGEVSEVLGQLEGDETVHKAPHLGPTRSPLAGNQADAINWGPLPPKDCPRLK